MLPDFLSDVSENYGPVPSALIPPIGKGVLWQASPNRFRFEIPEVFRVLIEDGCRVTKDLSAEADVDDTERLFRMTPLAALLYQRGVFAVHAAVVAGTNGAVLIAGDSGSGKSTLLAALLKRGYGFLSDELAAVDLDHDGHPVVFPMYPELVLWSDALDELNMAYKGKGRHAFAMKDRFITTPQPLKAVFRIMIHNDEHIVTEINSGVNAFKTFTFVSYNSRIAGILLNRIRYMNVAGALSRITPCHILQRPRKRWCVEELADQVEREL